MTHEAEWRKRQELLLDRIHDQLSTIQTTLVKQEANLREHMRRTDLAEAGIKLLQTDLQRTRTDITEEIEPLKRHVDGIRYIIAAIGVLSFLATSAIGALKFYDSLKTKGEETNAPVPEVRIQPKGEPAGRGARPRGR